MRGDVGELVEREADCRGGRTRRKMRFAENNPAQQRRERTRGVGGGRRVLEIAERVSRRQTTWRLTSKMVFGRQAQNQRCFDERNRGTQWREMLVPKSRMQASERGVRRWIELSAR